MTEPFDPKISPEFSEKRAAFEKSGMSPYIKYIALAITTILLALGLITAFYPTDVLSQLTKKNKVSDEYSFYSLFRSKNSNLPEPTSTYYDLSNNAGLKLRFEEDAFLQQAAIDCSLSTNETRELKFKIKTLGALSNYAQFAKDNIRLTNDWLYSGIDKFKSLKDQKGIYNACIDAELLLDEWTKDYYLSLEAVKELPIVANKRIEADLLIKNSWQDILKNDFDESDNKLVRVIQGDFDIFSKSRALLQRAESDKREHDKQQASEDQRTAIIDARGSEPAVDDLKVLQSGFGNNDKLNNLIHAIELDKSSKNIFKRAEFYLDHADLFRAFDDFKILSTRLENKDFSLALKAYLLYHVDNCNESLSNELFSEAFIKKPKEKFLWFYRGLYWAESARPLKAIDDFTQAIQLDSKFYPAIKERAIALASIGKNILALKDINNVISQEDDNSDNYRIRALVYIMLGDSDNALLDADQSILLNPLSSINYRTRAQIYEKKGDGDRAISDLRIASGLNKSDKYLQDELNLLAVNESNLPSKKQSLILSRTNRTVGNNCEHKK